LVFSKSWARRKPANPAPTITIFFGVDINIVF
jgi:hypothetical protein